MHSTPAGLQQVYDTRLVIMKVKRFLPRVKYCFADLTSASLYRKTDNVRNNETFCCLENCQPTHSLNAGFSCIIVRFEV